MKRIQTFLIVVVLFVLMLLSAQSTFAMTITNLTITLGCTGFSWAGTDSSGNYTIIADRDNTGSGMEAFTIEITDGAGTVIHQFTNQLASPGIYFNPDGSSAYNTGTPAFNPISYTWTSLAGNSLPAQVVYSTTGTCPGLPTFGGGSTGDDGPRPGPPFLPGDDRVNVEPWASVAIRCEGQEIHVYAIDGNSRGELALVATEAEIAAVDARPAVNTLIDSAGSIRLYRLTGGEFQVNAPSLPPEPAKEYVFIWDSCPVPPEEDTGGSNPSGTDPVIVNVFGLNQ
jgi:hypothetical protein